MAKARRSLLGFALPALGAGAAYAAPEPDGGRDHPLISRFAGSELIHYGLRVFDEANLTRHAGHQRSQRAGIHLLAPSLSCNHLIF